MSTYWRKSLRSGLLGVNRMMHQNSFEEWISFVFAGGVHMLS